MANSNPVSRLWCYIQGHQIFRITILSIDTIIDDLKRKNYEEQVKLVVDCGSSSLTLWKVRYPSD